MTKLLFKIIIFFKITNQKMIDSFKFIVFINKNAVSLIPNKFKLNKKQICQIYLKRWFSISTKNGIGIENVVQILIKK